MNSATYPIHRDMIQHHAREREDSCEVEGNKQESMSLFIIEPNPWWNCSSTLHLRNENLVKHENCCLLIEIRMYLFGKNCWSNYYELCIRNKIPYWNANFTTHSIHRLASFSTHSNSRYCRGRTNHLILSNTINLSQNFTVHPGWNCEIYKKKVEQAEMHGKECNQAKEQNAIKRS